MIAPATSRTPAAAAKPRASATTEAPRGGDLDRILGDDPAGAYPFIDARTRRNYHEAITCLARRARQSDADVAAAALALARDAAGANDAAAPRRYHVGYYLVDRGRARLAAAVGTRCPLGWRLRDLPAGGWLTVYAAFVIGAALGIAHAIMAWGPWPLSGWRGLALGAIATIIATPLTTFAAARLIQRLFPPRRLPRMDCSGGVPAEARTLVVVPCMLGSITAIDELARNLEQRSAGNRDEHVGFCLISDLLDADQEHTPEDAALLAHSRARIDELNTRHGGGFAWFHRPRRWNDRDRVWMGWERKRGKLEDFNAHLIDGADRFEIITGDAACLRAPRFVITLDEDTGLSSGDVRRLVALIAHPLNRPCYDPATRRVVAGYGVLQPRMNLVPDPRASRYEWLLGRLRGPGVEEADYTAVCSDVYQDLLGQGIFWGKGIYDVAVFHRVLHRRFPDNQILSHDMLEGAIVRAGLINDLPLPEDIPPTYLANMARHHRWMRGDWQLAPYLWPTVRDARGQRSANPISALGYMRVIDYVRAMLISPAALASFALGWLASPRPGRWTLITLALLWSPVVAGVILKLPGSFRSRRRVLDRLLFPLAAAALQVAMMVHEAHVTLDAVTRASVRMWITRRRLLQWTPFKTLNRRLHPGLAGHYRAIWLSPLSAAIFGGCLAWARPAALPISLGLLVAWLASPALAWWLSRSSDAAPGQRASRAPYARM